MNDEEIVIDIEDPAWSTAIPGLESVIRLAVRAAITSDSPAAVGEVVVLLTDDAAVRGLNAQFRGKDQPTNVLSFPPADMPGLETPPPLGDLALAFGVCEREAREQRKPLAHHVAHLVIHGVLHLMGYDHIEESEAEAMEALERRLLAALNIPDPYAERAERP